MNRGYVKLWRKIHDTGFFKNHSVLALMVWALTKATYKPYSTLVSGVVVNLEPGQFVFTRRNAAEDLGLSQRQVRTAFSVLHKSQFMTSQATSRFTVITITNWDIYQNTEDANDQPIDQQTTSPASGRRPTDDQQTTHPQEVKKGKKEKKKEGFVPPSLEEVTAYCLERGNGIDPEYFIAKNETIGWVTGKPPKPVQSWKGLIITWEKNEQRYGNRNTPPPPATRPPEYEDASDYEAFLMKQMKEGEAEIAEERRLGLDRG